MQDYWAEVAPPIDVLVAGFMGFKPRKKFQKSEKSGDLGDLLRLFPGGSIQ